MSHSRPAVAAVANEVAMTTWPMAAPPAGGAAGGRRSRADRCMSRCYTDPCNIQTCSLGPVTDVTQTELTIDELARRTGMTVRNIRAHQSRGLLPPPEVRGRTGYYGPDHVARLELIRELQSEGFNLEAIRRLVTGTETSAEVLRFTRT